MRRCGREKWRGPPSIALLRCRMLPSLVAAIRGGWQYAVKHGVVHVSQHVIASIGHHCAFLERCSNPFDPHIVFLRNSIHHSAMRAAALVAATDALEGSLVRTSLGNTFARSVASGGHHADSKGGFITTHSAEREEPRASVVGEHFPSRCAMTRSVQAAKWGLR